MRRALVSLFLLAASGVATPLKQARNTDGVLTSQDKYFHESAFHTHYDQRFASAPLSYMDRQQYLRSLIQTYHLFTSQIGAETWLMHGSLLGWYWNRRVMPWDSDVDVMVSEHGIRKLANWYNMTVHHFRFPKRWEDFEWEVSRDYLLEVNDHWTNGSTQDRHNAIDARWIDMENGLFIDITTLRWEDSAGGEESSRDARKMVVKDGHSYSYDDIFPLRPSDFEGVNVSVPFAYPSILTEEYGNEALSDVHYWDHRFDVHKKTWVPFTWVDLEQEKADGEGTAYWGERRPPNVLNAQPE